MCSIKAFLYSWLGKSKVTPEYEIRPVGNKHKPRFLCELRVPGHDYVACGNSTNKKDAQTNSAKDFLMYLNRNGYLQDNELPDNFQENGGLPGSSQGSSSKGLGLTQRPVFQPGFGPSSLGEAYHPVGKDKDSLASFRHEFIDKANKQQLEAQEDTDINSSIHGNWNLENAKSMLHQWMQSNKIRSDYKYHPIGPDHNRSFFAEMVIYVKELKRNIQAREAGSNKLFASKNCALSLVRQLFHLGVLGAYTGTLKVNKDADKAPLFDVDLDESVVREVQEVLRTLEAKPVDVASLKEQVSADNPLNLIGNGDFVSKLLPKTTVNKGGVVAWCPPKPNWNPWQSCNIDEGPLASASMEQISEDILRSWSEQQKVDQAIKEQNAIRANLPIYGKKADILNAIYNNPVVLIRGTTGCGKTTQVCQYILDDYIQSGQASLCNIVVTQPRRISAVTVADRVASERCEDLGLTSGYSVRFESVLPRPYGSILFCTVGVLLKKLESGLRGISHVIVDEIHERDVNTDFILVVLRDMVHMYPDLRIILMSATVDTTLFSQYFNECAILEIPDRVFSVQEYYLEDCIQMTNFVPSLPLKKNNRKDDDDCDDDIDGLDVPNTLTNEYSEQTKATLKMIGDKAINFELIGALMEYIEGLNIHGAILIFLPGWNTIFALMKWLQEHPTFGGPKYCILPLHSQLPCEDQRRCFHNLPDGITKVILSTNIAESSITINDVVYVIDSCKAKMKLFTSHNNMTNYATVWASRTNLQQRRGRAGRVRPGFAFHLCSRARYETLDEHMTPEMFRTPLHEISLSIKLLRLGSIGHFLSKALEPPPIDAVIEAEVLLREMKCLDCNDELTPLGKVLARMPVEPRLGKMMIFGCLFSCGDALCTIAAQASCGAEIFTTDMTRGRLTFRQQAFAGSKFSDHIAALNAFNQWENAKEYGEQSEMNFCDQKGINVSTMRVTWEAKRQLKDLLIQNGFPEECLVPQDYNFSGLDPKLDVVIALLVMGLYPNICMHKEKRKVLTTEARTALVHKSSVNCSREAVEFPLPFFVFGEKIRTKAVSCKQMTMVSPIHLILFGCKKIELCENGIVRMDNWINLKVDPKHVAMIAALRPSIESLIIQMTCDPEGMNQLLYKEESLIKVIRTLCNATQIGRLKRLTQQASTEQDGGPPPKKRNLHEPLNEDEGIVNSGGVSIYGNGWTGKRSMDLRDSSRVEASRSFGGRSYEGNGSYGSSNRGSSRGGGFFGNNSYRGGGNNTTWSSGSYSSRGGYNNYNQGSMGYSESYWDSGRGGSHYFNNFNEHRGGRGYGNSGGMYGNNSYGGRFNGRYNRGWRGGGGSY